MSSRRKRASTKQASANVIDEFEQTQFPCDECGYWIGVGPDCRSCKEARTSVHAFYGRLELLRTAWKARVARLGELGHAPRIGLVGCGKAKRQGSHAARELYIGSLFRRSLAHSEAEHDETYILSAQHHLLRTTEIVESYDFWLENVSPAAQHRWAIGVLGQLGSLFPHRMTVEFIILAGQVYARPILHAAREQKLAWSFSTPMAGMHLLERMRWLAFQKTKRVRRACTLCDQFRFLKC